MVDQKELPKIALASTIEVLASHFCSWSFRVDLPDILVQIGCRLYCTYDENIGSPLHQHMQSSINDDLQICVDNQLVRLNGEAVRTQ